MFTLRHSALRFCVSLPSQVFVVAVSTFLSSFCLPAFGDSIDERLVAAKEQYESARADAKEAVLVSYRDLISTLSEDKKVEAAIRVQDEMKYFEKDGIMCARSEMTVAFCKYGETQKKLAAKLIEAYTDAAAANAKAGNLDKAESLRRELAACSLPTKLVSIKQLRSNEFIMHGDFKGQSKPAKTLGDKMNGTFEIINGLSGSDFVSIRSANCPKHYLNHEKFRILLSPYYDNDGYRRNATFKRVKGLASPTGVSFESVNFPDHYIHAREGELWVDKDDRTDRFRQESTFLITEPLLKLWGTER